MRKLDCAREDELLEALQTSRWPETCDASLCEHVEACAACTDLLLVAAPLLSERRALVHEASVPSSAVVWWRAQMRSRREAAEKAAQPVSVALGIAVACAAGLLATALGIVVPTFRRGLLWLVERSSAAPSLPDALSWDPLTSPYALAALAGVLLCLLAAPIALYVTFRED